MVFCKILFGGDSLLMMLTTLVSFSQVPIGTQNDGSRISLPPPNDTLAGAIPITPSAAGTGCATVFTLNFTTDGTTDSGMDGSCDGTNTGLDQFFTWTATTTGLIFWSDFPTYPGIVIRDTSGTEIDCVQMGDQASLSGWAIGDDLIIQIYDSGGHSSVSFCLQEATPAPNDTLAGAIPITPSPAGTGCTTAPTFTLNFTSEGTTDSGMNSSCDGTNTGLDQFFTWTATTDGLIFWSGLLGNPGIVIRDASGTEIDCIGTFDDGFLSGWAIGDDLIIQIYDTGSFSDVTFCLQEATAAPNDTLAGAIPITPSPAGTGCTTAPTFTLNFTSEGTTDSGMNSSCSGTNTGLDQFFTWTATTNGLIFWSESPGFPRIAIRDTSGTEIDCIGTFDDGFLSGWAIGDDLIIQIYSHSTLFSDVAFCLQEATQAPNDTLAGAIPITPSAAGTGCTTASTFTLNFTSEGTTDSGMDGSCDGTNTGLDQFFTWTAASEGLVFRSGPRYSGIVIRDTSGAEIDCIGTGGQGFLSGWAIGDDLIIQIYDSVNSFSDVSFCLQKATQAPNDTLAGAIPIIPSVAGTGCTTASTFTLNFTSEGTTDSGMDGSCSGTSTGLDQFFTWTATTNGLIFWSGSLGDPGIVIRDTSGTEIDCIGTGGQGFLSGWAIGDDLIIQVYDRAGYFSDVLFCLQEATQAPNDTLVGAIPIIPSVAGTGCTTASTFTLNFTSEGTTDSGMDGSCNGTSTGLDQFFTWTATTNGLIFWSDSPTNPGIVIRDTSGTEIDCIRTGGQGFLSGWAINDDLIIQIYSHGGLFSDVSFCLQEATQAPNDILAGAIPITPSLAGTGCTTASTFTLNFTSEGTTDSGMDGSCSGTSTGLDQFFTWTATTDGLIFWSGSTGFSGIVIRDTSGNEIDCIGTNGRGFLSGWAIGDDLIIQIYDSSISFSDVTFCLQEVTTPPNDNCANATVVGSLPFTETLDATGATNDGGFVTSCSPGMNDGVWYTFTTVDAGTIDIAISGVIGWNAEVALYSGSCGTFTCVSSIDNTGTGGNETLSGVTVAAATQYWINIGHYSGVNDDFEGPFTIDISTSDTTTLGTTSTWIGNNNLSIYKPNASTVRIVGLPQGNTTVKLFNIFGKEILNTTFEANDVKDISVSKLAVGIYIVRVQTELGTLNKKIILEY